MLPDGWVKSLMADGIIAGLGDVVLFLPQILIRWSMAAYLFGLAYAASFIMYRLTLLLST